MPAAPGRARARSRLLLALLVVIGVLILAGVGVAYQLLNDRTEPERSTPTVAVRQFLNAAFRDRDEAQLRLFVCPEWTASRTAQVWGSFDPQVRVSPETVVEESRQDGQASVTARLRLVFQGYVDFQQWRFQVVDRNGWRVCSAEPVPTQPAATGQPTGPGQPGQSAGPGQPGQSADPGQPASPPAGPEQSTSPGQPAGPR